MSGKKIEGYWDCTYCGTKGIGGLTKTCPKCGNPQAKNLKFYVKPGEKKYLEPEVAKEYGKGADWICEYCGSYNRYNITNCKRCGAGKDEAEEDYFGKKVKDIPKEDTLNDYEANENPTLPFYEKEDRSDNLYGYDNSYKSDSFWDSNDYIDEEKRNITEGLQNFFSNINLKQILGLTSVALAIITVIMLFVSIFTPKNYDAQISDKTWERIITVQELKTFKEDDWSVPTGGRVYDERKEIRSYDNIIIGYETVEREVPREVFDHYDYDYEDNGDGTFTEITIPVYVTVYETVKEEVPIWGKLPVYDIKYYYEIDRWTYKRTEESSGKTDEPYWPEFNLANKERESGRNETYTVYFKVDEEEKTFSKKISYEEWKAYKLKAKVKITVVAGVITEVVP